jgi:cholesterol transport system auxiliary component
MRNSKLILTIGLMTALVSLAGCAGKIRYPSYYVLNLPTALPATRSAPILGSVAVREFDAPRFLREGPIAYRPSPEQLDFYDYHRWAEDPRRVVTAAMVRRMQSRGLFQSVDMFDGRGFPECLLTGTIDHLEEVDQGTNVSIEVTLSARLIQLRTGEVLWQDTSSKTAKLDQRSIPGIVAEMSQDLGSTVERLVSSMQDRLSAASSSLNRSYTKP